MTEATISLVDTDSLLSLFGARDRNLRRIREAFSVDITHRDGEIHVAGIIDVSGPGLTLAAWFKADGFPGASSDPRLISKASSVSTARPGRRSTRAAGACWAVTTMPWMPSTISSFN